MPFKSAKQRRYIYEKASEGEKWAKKFVKDSGGDQPKAKKKTKKK